MRLRIAPHTQTSDTVVEIWDDKLGMIGVVYPQPRGVRIISKYIENTADLVCIEVQEPAALVVNLVQP